jgi:large subunit ribosomal protein L24
MASKIRKGDTVVVITGRDKGRSGEVLRVMPDDNRVLVDGVNMVKKHKRPSAASAGGIETMAAPIHVSNVAHKDPKSGNATRIGFKFLEDGRKVRFDR